MNAAATYEDGYCRSFREESDFTKFLQTIDGRSVWERNPANTIRFMALEKDKPAPKGLQTALH